MTIIDPTVDDLAQVSSKLARGEVAEILGGKDHITMDDMTACELLALLTIVRPAWQRKVLARRHPAPVLELVLSGKSQRV